jgi:hypothetical protein
LKHITNKATLCQLQNEYRAHIDLVQNERKKYYHHREKSKRNPKKYLTIIVDGMDQNKTNVPQLPNKCKSTQNLWILRTHLTGALAHTQSEKGKRAYAFFDIMQFPHDCNLTIEVILQILIDMKKNYQIQPEVLYLQLDNCFKENKNKYILGFCSLLVIKNIFKKVNMQCKLQL